MFDNTTLMEQGEGIEWSIHVQTFMMEIQMNVKIPFSIPPPPESSLDTIH